MTTFLADIGIDSAFITADNRFKVEVRRSAPPVGSSRVDLQACKLEYSIVSPK